MKKLIMLSLFLACSANAKSPVPTTQPSPLPNPIIWTGGDTFIVRA